MFEAIVDGALVVLDYFRNVHLGILSSIDRYRDGIEFLSCGLMFGSGAVLPPLSPESLGLGGLCKAMLGLWALSFVTFTWLKRMELAVNAPWALAGLSIVSILAILFSRISFEQFTPYVPFSIATGMLMTVQIVPRVISLVWSRNTLFPDEIRLERQNVWIGSERASISSNRSEEEIHGVLGPFPPWDPLLLSHMYHTDLDNDVRRIASSIGSVSSIDPGLRRDGHEDNSSTASGDSRDLLI